MMFTGVDLPCYAINWMFTGGDSQRFLALDEQKTTEHSNPADADAADGYFNEVLYRHNSHPKLKIHFSLPKKLSRVLSSPIFSPFRGPTVA